MCSPSAPSQQTQTTVSELPDWAKPAAQKVIAKGEALSDRQYVPYQGERIAGFTPMQQQAFGSAQQLGPSAAGQFGMGLAGEAGARALGAQFNPYQTGQFQGGTAASYMSPFIQEALEPQMREARRASEMQRNADQARAVQQGAFGGSRQAIVEAERQRNLGTQLGDIQARGLQSAFDRAQQQFNTEQQLREQSRQYGAGFGMQGLQTALQGAGQLGQLGSQAFGQQREAIGLQSQLGGQQQALEQQRLGQQYQDFLNQQRFPYQQLEFMSNLIRGTPMGTVQTMYSPPPNMVGQLAGLGAGFAGMMGSKPFGAKDGGLAEAYAEGGSVTSDEYVADVLGNLSDQQLAQARQEAMQRRDANRLEMIDQELAKRASIRQGMGSAFNALPEQDQERVLSAANGGIVAFADGGNIERYSGEFGSFVDGVGFGASAEQLAADELRRQELLRRRAEEGRYNAIVEGRTPTPPASAAPAPQPKVQQADLRRIDQAISAPEKPAEAKLSRSERSAVNKVATAMAAQAPVEKNSVKSDIESILRPGKAEDTESFNKIMGQIKEMTKLPEYDKNEALAKFGFAMALAASKPGAKILGSISEAAPQFLAHREEYRKKADEARKLAGQMGIEQAKLELAMRRDDRKTALDTSLKLKQLELQEEKMRQDAAYQKASVNRPVGIMAVYEELKRANPDAAPEALLRKASEISGFSFRSEAGQGAKLAEAIRKIDEDYKMLPALKASSAQSPFVQNMEAERQRRLAEAYRLYGGGQQPGAVTSASAPTYRFDAKGNMIQ